MPDFELVVVQPFPGSDGRIYQKGDRIDDAEAIDKALKDYARCVNKSPTTAQLHGPERESAAS